MATTPNLQSLLIITRYRKRYIPFAFLSMALFHIPLFFSRKIFFYKLMGCGKNGTFDIHPDFNQWAVMVFFKNDELTLKAEDKNPEKLLGTFISSWWKIFKTKKHWFLLEPYMGHGSWDGKTFINSVSHVEEPIGKIAVLTRATIRISRLKNFWESVPKAAKDLYQNKGLLYSVGVGEIPFIKQATFSVWESIADMKAYAYKKVAHQEVIQKTRKEKWYTEEMFLRFREISENKFDR